MQGPPPDDHEVVVTAAHELNGPIAAVIGLVDVLVREPSLPSTERLELLDAVARQTHHLANLVTDILEVAEDGAVAPELVPVRLIEVVADAVHSTVTPRGAQVAATVSGGVLAEQTGLTRVLANLLSNAHRYGGQHVVVTSRTDGGWVDIEVSDDGPGVPDADRESIFESFTRGGNTNGHHGLGIGLRLSRTLIESYGGTLSYEPAEMAGSVFTVRLPAAPAEPLTG